MKESFKAYLQSHERILHCGATGTALMAQGGAAPGGINSILHPDMVLKLQKEYVDAGAKMTITNTFSMNPIYAETHIPADYDWREINTLGVEIAKKAAGDRAYVLGNMGPIGELLEPFGALKPDDAYDAFRRQALIFAEKGVDGFSVQTFYHLEEMKLAVKAIRGVSDLPIVANFVFGRQGVTMMGDTPLSCYEQLMPLGIDVLGHNCGEIDFHCLGDVLEPLLKIAEIPISACPNAGLPKVAKGQTYYDMTPAQFREGTEYLLSKGVQVIGGCCGVHLPHIKAIADLF